MSNLVSLALAEHLPITERTLHQHLKIFGARLVFLVLVGLSSGLMIIGVSLFPYHGGRGILIASLGVLIALATAGLVLHGHRGNRRRGLGRARQSLQEQELRVEGAQGEDQADSAQNAARSPSRPPRRIIRLLAVTVTCGIAAMAWWAWGPEHISWSRSDTFAVDAPWLVFGIVAAAFGALFVPRLTRAYLPIADAIRMALAAAAFTLILVAVVAIMAATLR